MKILKGIFGRFGAQKTETEAAVSNDTNTAINITLNLPAGYVGQVDHQEDFVIRDVLNEQHHCSNCHIISIAPKNNPDDKINSLKIYLAVHDEHDNDPVGSILHENAKDNVIFIPYGSRYKQATVTIESGRLEFSYEYEASVPGTQALQTFGSQYSSRLNMKGLDNEGESLSLG